MCAPTARTGPLIASGLWFQLPGAARLQKNVFHSKGHEGLKDVRLEIRLCGLRGLCCEISFCALRFYQTHLRKSASICGWCFFSRFSTVHPFDALDACSELAFHGSSLPLCSPFARVRAAVTRGLRISGGRIPYDTFGDPDGRLPNYSAVNERWHVRRFETGMISITRLVAAAAAVFALATLCPAQEPTNLGNGQEFKGKNIEMKDKGEAAFLLSFPAGKEFEATTDGTKNTDVHLYVYDSTGKEVGKDDSPGPKCSVKIAPAKDGTYKFVIKNAGGDNTVTFDVKIAE